MVGGRRPIEHRVALRFPALATRVNAAVNRAFLALPRGWRIRQAFIEYAVRRAYEALTRGDVEVLRTLNHPDAVYDLSHWEWPEQTIYHGPDGAVQFNAQWIGQWSEMDFTLVSVEELERGLLLVHVHLRGIGRASRLELERNDYVVMKLRDGLVWRGWMCLDRAAALAAARSSAVTAAES